MNKILPFVVILLFGQILFSQSSVKDWEWVKYESNPIMEPAAIGAWDIRGVEAPSVLKLDGKYHMWYCNFIYTGIGYAFSNDGINWTKHDDNPVLEPGGEGTWSNETLIALPSVEYSGGIFHMWYFGFSGGNGELGYATSEDGVNWTKHPNNPVLGCGDYGCWDEKAVLGPGVIINNGQFKMWYVGSNQLDDFAGIGYASSNDGINWEKNLNPVITKNENETNIWAARVLNIGEEYFMWYTEGMWGGTRLDIRFAYSADGIEWSRETDNIAITRGELSEWDSKILGFPSVIYDEDENKYKMWFHAAGLDLVRKIGYAESDGPTGVEDPAAVPTEYSLSQNYPNPFNPITTIKYNIPAGVNSESSMVNVGVFDILGREIAVLVNKKQKSGSYEVEFNADQYPSGVYFYKLDAGDYKEVKKMVLLK